VIRPPAELHDAIIAGNKDFEALRQQRQLDATSWPRAGPDPGTSGPGQAARRLAPHALAVRPICPASPAAPSPHCAR
jgi:hypothetical protein